MFMYNPNAGSCVFGFVFAFINTTVNQDLKFEDVVILNNQYFSSNEYLHIDYDNEKIYFGGKNVHLLPTPGNDPNVPPPTTTGGNTVLIIVLVVVGLAVIAGIGFFCYKKRQANVSQGLSSYDKL
jgi:hypothetical protein